MNENQFTQPHFNVTHYHTFHPKLKPVVTGVTMNLWWFDRPFRLCHHQTPIGATQCRMMQRWRLFTVNITYCFVFSLNVLVYVGQFTLCFSLSTDRINVVWFVHISRCGASRFRVHCGVYRCSVYHIWVRYYSSLFYGLLPTLLLVHLIWFTPFSDLTFVCFMKMGIGWFKLLYNTSKIYSSLQPTSPSYVGFFVGIVSFTILTI